VLKFIANLFATSNAAKPATKARLSVETMEDRAVPALLANPGLIRGFNPQPEPPGREWAGDVAVRVASETPGSVLADRGFIIDGMRGDDVLAARGIVIAGG
jgi:hypothetical protein